MDASVFETFYFNKNVFANLLQTKSWKRQISDSVSATFND